MSAIQAPTQAEIEQAHDIIHRYAQVNKSSIQRDRQKIAREFEKDTALAAECEQVSQEIYKQVLDALPDEHSKELFRKYSTIHWGEIILSRERYADMKDIRGFCDRALRVAKKLLKRTK